MKHSYPHGLLVQLLKEIEPGSQQRRSEQRSKCAVGGLGFDTHGRKRGWEGAGVSSHRRSPVVSVWFQLLLGAIFPLLSACAKVELPRRLAFRVIGADGHQTHRAELGTPSAAD